MNEEKKNISLFNLICLGLGGAIGSGIFVYLGYGIAFTGRSILVAVVVGCLWMLLAYFYQIVMSSMFVFKGGAYSMNAMLYGPKLTGFSGIATFLGGAGMASYAGAMVGYVAEIIPGIAPYSKVLSIGVMTLFFLTTIKGSKFMATLQSLMTVVLVISIALFIGFGLPNVQGAFFSNADGGFMTSGWGGIIAAISIMSWACQGTTGPVAMSAVTENPKKKIPLSILVVTVALAGIYGLISYVAAGILPLDQVSGQNLSVTAKVIFPGKLYVIFILGGAVFAIATSLLGGIAALRYPIIAVAEDGWLPKVFTKTTKGGFPWVVSLTFYLVSIIPIMLDFSLDSMISLLMIPTMLMCCYANFRCIKLPKEYPDHWKQSVLHMPYPVFVVIMVLSCICDLLVAYNLFIGMSLQEMLMVVGSFVICIGITMISLYTKQVDLNDLMSKKSLIIEEAKASLT